jgi:hypothetical protein
MARRKRGGGAAVAATEGEGLTRLVGLVSRDLLFQLVVVSFIPGENES